MIVYSSINAIPELYIVSAIACMISAYVNLIALFAVYQPDVFMHRKAMQTEHKEPPKIRHIELSKDTAQALNDQLELLVDSHKPHLDEDISLSKLASLLGVTRSQLSELFNVHKQISFYDFLNDLRYQESIKLLSKVDVRLTIADIAYQAGFNNRNSFYKVFKEKEGVTPSQFRKRII